MLNEKPPRPDLQPVPAIITIMTKQPEHGWWDWTVSFEQAQYVDGNILAMHAAPSPAVNISHGIRCSDVFDPVPDLHIFVERIKATSDAQWQVDEEGCFVTMQSWYINSCVVHLRMYSTYYDVDYCHDFLLDRNDFMHKLKAACHSFGKDGGWGDSLDKQRRAPASGTLTHGYRIRARVRTKNPAVAAPRVHGDFDVPYPAG